MISKIFKSRIPSCNYAFRSGDTAHFMLGSYATHDPDKIYELMNEVKNVGKTASSHPFIYVDENEQEIDSEALTPFELMKAQAKKEAMEELLAAGMMSNVTSTSDTSGFAASLTDSISAGPTGMESNGAPVGAALMPQTAGAAKLAALSATSKK